MQNKKFCLKITDPNIKVPNLHSFEMVSAASLPRTMTQSDKTFL